MKIVNVVWDIDAWKQYTEWQSIDKKTVSKINKLIVDITRNGHAEGIGKPEPLCGNLSGYWSRRIDDKNRIVYKVSGENVIIISCEGHYGDK